MTPSTRLLVLGAWLTLVTASDAAAPPARTALTVLEARTAPEWDARFAGKKGWIGGDAVYSVALGKERYLWLFGDTLLGEVKDGKRVGSVMVNNTLAIQTGTGKESKFRFVHGKTKEDKPAAFFVPEGKGWFWPMDGVRSGGRLFVFLPLIDKGSGKGVFGFRHVGQWLGVIDNPDDEPEKWRTKLHELKCTDFTPGRERSWGSAVLADGEYVYVYGYAEQGKGMARRKLLVARVPAGKLDDFSSWRFRTSTGWSEKSEEAAALADGLATEFSVSRLGGKGYVAVYTDNGLGDRIVARHSETPYGPWTAPVLLYRCLETSKDKGVFCYSSKAHAWAADGDELLVSYCVNAWDFWRLFRDESVYRPKFVRVKLGWGK